MDDVSPTPRQVSSDDTETGKFTFETESFFCILNFVFHKEQRAHYILHNTNVIMDKTITVFYPKSLIQITT